MGQRNTLQDARLGHGFRPAVSLPIKAFAVAEVRDLGRLAHTKIGVTVVYFVFYFFCKWSYFYAGT